MNYGKKVLCLCLAIAPMFCNAQGSYGIKGGFSYDKLSHNPSLLNAYTARKVGFGLGVFGEYDINSFFAFKLETNLRSKNYENNGVIDYSSSSYNHSVEIPYLVDWQLWCVETPISMEVALFNRIRLSSGVYYAFFFKGDGTFKAENGVTYTQFFSDFYSQHDFGYILSLGLRLTNTFLLRLSWQESIVDISKSDHQYSSKMNGFQLSLSYFLYK